MYITNPFLDILTTLLSAGTKFNDKTPWWRGHGLTDWKLRPSVYRKSYNEKELYLKFKRQARPRHSPCPDPDEFASWLFLMQHYRLPTRLLDWTESPLIALFFAISDVEYLGETGALWAVQPSALNKCQLKTEGILASNHPLVSPIIEEPSRKVGDKGKEKTAAVITEEIDIRMMAQLSAFTVHGTSTPIEDLPDSESFVMKFEISKENKQVLKVLLRAFGIRKSWLFPDLEHLAQELAEEVKPS